MILQEKLNDCIVKIWPDKNMRSANGTGFFVGPGLILTCYHVIADAKQSEIEIKWREDTLLTVVSIKSFHDTTAWKWPDLSLLEVDFKAHPCVLLSQQYEQNDLLYGFGYTKEYPGGDSFSVNIEGYSNSPELLKLKEGQIQPGFSGSPLLNLRTGGVCGILKRTRNENSDIGGRGVSTTTILSHFPELILLQSGFHNVHQDWLAAMSHAQLSAFTSGHPGKKTFPPIGFLSENNTYINYDVFHQLNAGNTIRAFGSWTPVSPCSGYIRTIAINPLDPRNIYMGMDFHLGLFVSNDEGASWEIVSFFQGKNIHCIEISNGEGIIYVSADKGVWKSRNGYTWEPLTDLQHKEVLKIAVSPHDNRKMVFGLRKQGGVSAGASTIATTDQITSHDGVAEEGIAVTNDEGKKWRTFMFPKTGNDIAFDETDGRIAYIASIDEGLYKTEDSFKTLSKVQEFEDKKPLSIAICPQHSEYIAIGTLNCLYMSWDGGKVWQEATDIEKCQVSDICFITNSPNKMLAGTVNGLYESDDFGRTWKKSNNGIDSTRIMAVNSNKNDQLFVGSSGGGVYRKLVAHRTWLQKNSGLPTIPCLAIQLTDDYIFAGCMSGLYMSKDHGNTWALLGLDGRSVDAVCLLASKGDISYDAQDAGIIISNDTSDSFETNMKHDFVLLATTVNGVLHRYDSRNNTWDELHSFADPSDYQHTGHDIYVSATNKNTLLVKTGTGEIFRSLDGGGNWQPIPPAKELISTLSLFDLPGEVLFAGTSSGLLYTSSDHGDNWQSHTTTFSTPVTAIHRSSQHTPTLYLSTLSGMVYVSRDKGATWEMKSQLTGYKFSWTTLCIVPGINESIYLGTSKGVFLFKEDTLTFEPLDGGILGQDYYVNFLKLYQNKLYAGMKEGLFCQVVQ